MKFAVSVGWLIIVYLVLNRVFDLTLGFSFLIRYSRTSRTRLLKS